MEINKKRILFKTSGVLGRISKGGGRRKERGIAEKVYLIKIKKQYG